MRSCSVFSNRTPFELNTMFTICTDERELLPSLRARRLFSFVEKCYRLFPERGPMTNTKSDPIIDPTRRDFLRKSFAGMGWVMAGTTLSRCASEGNGSADDEQYRQPRTAPRPRRERPPPPRWDSPAASSRARGCRSAARTTSGTPPPTVARCSRTDDGGWIYVSNSETPPQVGGGASALRFSSNGDIVDAYRILSDTWQNCAGGATPWGTWLSCEETDAGHVWECDPLGERDGVRASGHGGRSSTKRPRSTKPINTHT